MEAKTALTRPSDVAPNTHDSVGQSVKANRLGLRWLGFLLAVLLQSSVVAAELEGQVVGVLDGDTIDVLTTTKTQVRVRLAGIDAPEKGQAFGNVSKKELSDLVFGKQVSVEWRKMDRYGRTVGKVIVDGVNANLKMVEAGLAWHYKQYAREQSPTDRASYAQAEERARAEAIGLWQDKLPIQPWVFRKRPQHAV